jgi:hypothetical protein
MGLRSGLVSIAEEKNPVPHSTQLSSLYPFTIPTGSSRLCVQKNGKGKKKELNNLKIIHSTHLVSNPRPSGL